MRLMVGYNLSVHNLAAVRIVEENIERGGIPCGKDNRLFNSNIKS